jgi:hypothetical protein
MWKLSASDMCTIIQRLLRQDQYWAAEVVMKVMFLANFGLSRQDNPSYDLLQEAWASIQWFFEEHRLQDGKHHLEEEKHHLEEEEHPLQDEEQELWAKIAILQTFCEGLLRCSRAADIPACEWSFTRITSLLQGLVNQALLRDEKEEWSRSRAFVREKLLELDKDVADAVERGDIVWSRAMFETLLQLSQISEGNQDLTIESAIHWRIRTLGYGEGPKARADPSLIPLEVYAQRERALAEMRNSPSNKVSVGGIEWWPSPIKLLENEEQKERSHKGTTDNEQGFSEGASEQKEVVLVETAAPGETLPALLEAERETNRHLRQEVQRLKRSVTDLTSASMLLLLGLGEAEEVQRLKDLIAGSIPSSGDNRRARDSVPDTLHTVAARGVDNLSLGPSETLRGRLSRSEGPPKISLTQARSASPHRATTQLEHFF